VDGSGAAMSWESVSNRAYFIDRAAGLGTGRVFVPVAIGISGLSESTSFVDMNAIDPGPLFYRVGVEQ
jgi:hypothetical protein